MDGEERDSGGSEGRKGHQESAFCAQDQNKNLMQIFEMFFHLHLQALISAGSGGGASELLREQPANSQRLNGETQSLQEKAGNYTSNHLLLLTSYAAPEFPALAASFDSH